MTQEEFDCLHEVEQEELIFNEGIFLENDSEENIIFDIYQLHDFYVQFSYELHKNERAIITTFKDRNDLFIYNKMNTLATS